jgi:hypothetical protein
MSLHRRFHLNGNAVYNVSHSFVREVASAELSVMSAPDVDVPFSSFDVRFCETAMHDLGHTESTLESLGYARLSITFIRCSSTRELTRARVVLALLVG